MGCQYIYKDANGNISAIYKRALAKYGPERAEEIYIRHMMMTIDTRFSHKTTSSIDERSGRIQVLEADKSHYTETTSGKKYDRPTEVVANITENPNLMSGFWTAKSTGEKTGLEAAREYLAKQLLWEYLTPEEKLIEGAVDKKILKDSELLVKAEHDIQALWKAQEVAGTQYHELASLIINEWEKVAQAHEDAGEPDIAIGELGAIIAKVKNDSLSVWQIDGRDKFSESDMYHGLHPLFEFVVNETRRLNKLPKAPGDANRRIRLKSEVKVYSDKLKVPNSGVDGLAGSIDVLLFTADKLYNKTLDFKTKIQYKSKDFNKATGRVITGPFNMVESPVNKSIAQQLFYSAIMRQAEYGQATDEALTIVVPIDFGVTNLNQELGAKEFRTYGISAPEGDPNATTKSRIWHKDITTEIGPVITWLTKGDVRTVYEKARVDGIAGTTEKWSGENEDGVPNATWSKDHKVAAVETALLKKRIPTGKTSPVVSLWFETIDVGGKTDDEIRVILGKAYDAAKTSQNSMSSDLARWFANQSSPIPKSFAGKHDAVAALFQGISPLTHTVHQAEKYNEVFHGIGPDVLIAIDNITGAVTLLSAVVTTKNKIKFKGDGSKNKRTSLYGNYVEDKELESGMLPVGLMTEPTTHDFISMKLGLAAMMLRRISGSKLHIDKMRVVSMGYANSVFVTPTTFEQELAKIKLFKKYAPKDFPSEYSELLKETEDVEYKGATAKHLEHLILHIAKNTDPLQSRGKQLKEDILKVYGQYQAGRLNGFELRTLLGKYVEAVAIQLHYSESDVSRVLSDPRMVAASKALAEFARFENDLGKLAAERCSVAAMNGAVSSGDTMQIRLHVIYNEASARIRHQMDQFYKDHMSTAKSLRKRVGTEFALTTTKMFENLYRKSSNPEDRMMLKDENDPSLTKEEQDYIKFFNDNIMEDLIRCSPANTHEGIRNGSLWKRGTVPTIYSHPELLQEQSFRSWKGLKEAVSATISRMKKKTELNMTSFLDFKFSTQFDDQASDSSHGHSETRRQMLGIKDLNAVVDQNPNIETNLILIANLCHLEAAEKEHYAILLQEVVAAQSILASAADRNKTNMSADMINTWKELIIKNQYKEEPLQPYLDPVNRLSSQLLFNFSLAQAMTEFSTGTLQTTSAAISNSVQNAWAAFIGKPENAGRYTMKDWAWGVYEWDRRENGKLFQIVRDNGMLVADADDWRNAEFEGATKAGVFQSEAGFALNRIFFDASITHTFLAQMKHMNIPDAYVKQGNRWIYDETKDSRFYVYDPDTKMGTTPPVTDDDKKKHSVWLATRKMMELEGMLNPETKTMKGPLTSNERAEIKHYATRTYGSFNKDGDVNGEAWVLGRSMLRYKKWAMQKKANWWTPTVENDMWGHWETVPDGQGGYKTTWVGDSFQGILQTVGFVISEIASARGISMAKNLNKYQRENLSKLFADLCMWIMMMLMVIPFLKDTTEEVDAVSGETVEVKGDFAKSEKGKRALRSATNATQDLFFLSSFFSFGQGPTSQTILSNILPGFGVMGMAAGGALTSMFELIAGDPEKAGQTAATTAGRLGIIRTGKMFAEPLMAVSN
jgi:hypothetical protein